MSDQEIGHQRMSGRAKFLLFGGFGGLLLMIFVGLFANGDDPVAEQEAKINGEQKTTVVKSAADKGDKALDSIKESNETRANRRRMNLDLGKTAGEAPKTEDPKPENDSVKKSKVCAYPKNSVLSSRNEPGCTPRELLGDSGPSENETPNGIREPRVIETRSAAQDPAEQARRQMLEQIRSRKSQMFQEAMGSKIAISTSLSTGGSGAKFDPNDPKSIAAERERVSNESQRLASISSDNDIGDGGGGFGGVAPSGDNYPPDPNNPGASVRSQLSGAQSYGQMKADGWDLGNRLENPSGKYEIRAGMVIPATLISGINSDLPGQLTAQVSQNVWDTATGKYLMIPQGTRLVGTYASAVAYGQERVMMAWQRLIFPDGRTLDIGAMPGADMAGFAGAHDQVNNHWFKMLGAAFLMSGITAAVSVSVDNNTSSTDSTKMSDTMRESLASQFGTVIENVIQKNLNISPTLEIRPGYRFNVIVTKDMIFKKPYKLFDY